jgi:hypothetical protein
MFGSTSQDTKTWSVGRPGDLVSGFGARNLRAIGEFANRLNQHVPINARLSRPEIVSGPFQNIRKVDFSGSTEADAPLLPGHTALFDCPGDDLLRQISQIGLEVFATDQITM